MAWADLDERIYADGTVPGWNARLAPNDWDRCMLGAFDVPGVVSVTASPGRRVKRETKHGSNHEKVTVIGYSPADVDIEITIWTESQYEILVSMIRTLFPKNTAADGAAYDIVHPALEMYSIRQVRLIQCSTLSSGPLPKRLRIKALEFVPEPPGKQESVARRTKLRKRDVAKQTNAVQKVGVSIEENKKKRPSTKQSVTNEPNYSASPNQ